MSMINNRSSFGAPCSTLGWRVAIAVCLASVAVACGGGTGRGDGDAAKLPPAVEALPARAGALPLEETLSGVVRALNQVAIRPELSATVVDVLARNGDRVERGQPLVRLDDSQLRERLRQAEAGLRSAEAAAFEARARLAEIEAEVKRIRALAPSGLASDMELEIGEARLEAARAQADQAEARVEAERAAVEERRAAMAKSVVRAPVSGLVGQRDVEVGMVVDPGTTMFLLGDFDDLVVEVPLTQEMLRHVEVGTPVEITARERTSEPVAATISRISPFLEQSSFSTTAEIDVPGNGSGFRPGMFVTVRVLYGASERATLVPSSALWEDPKSGDQTVYVVLDPEGLVETSTPPEEIPERPRAVTRRFVQVLAEGRGRTGVDGVEPGEWVVTVGQQLLHQALQAGEGDAVAARVRPTGWERVLGLQSLQREDLLEEYLAKQRTLARALGADMPEDIEAVDRVLDAAEADTASEGSTAPVGGGS